MALNLGQRQALVKLLLDLARLTYALAVVGPLVKPDVISGRGWLIAGFAVLLLTAWALKLGEKGGSHDA